MMATSEGKDGWIESHANLAAIFVTLLGLAARIWMASGTFLNPDEALHFRLANQLTLQLAYREALTASHPPLLILILYFWRALGTSELWLRMPSVVAGTVFCWMFYKWLARVAGTLSALIGLLFVAFLPPIVQIGSEVRQYSLLLAFLACALYFLDKSIAEHSSHDIVAFSLFLYLAMLSHYSAFLSAAALGIYALIQFLTRRAPDRLVAVWAIGQIIAVAIALFFYKTHISKLGAGESRTVSQGWMSDLYLRHSYFDRAHDNPLVFLIGHSFGVFQYFFEQLAVGDVMAIFFVAGVVLLLRGKDSAGNQRSARQIGIFLLLSFAVAGGASLAHLYPYGGTRHVAFLVIPAITGVSVAVARVAGNQWNRGLSIAAIVLLVCLIFGKARQPRMARADQSRARMADAMRFVNQNMSRSDLILTDYQTDLVLGHYLCRQQPISFEPAPANFEQFSCAGHRVASTDFTTWMFSAENFPGVWRRFLQTYPLKAGTTVWVFQAGWNPDLPEELQQRFREFHDLRFDTFGNDIKTFKMTVGQPMPSAIILTSLPVHIVR